MVKTLPLDFIKLSSEESAGRSQAFFDTMTSRRSVRDFSTEKVPLDVVRQCIASACQAPSGANRQPWTFVMITDPTVKRAIREAAEQEEEAFYQERASQTWLQDIAHLGTGPEKRFLEEAPVLIALFAQRYSHDDEGERRQHYYVSESVGIAAGFLIAALHHAGLATLTHTPSPLSFLNHILERPDSERGYMLLPVGYPKDGCEVPALPSRRINMIEVG